MPYSEVGDTPIDLVSAHGLTRGASYTLQVTGANAVLMIEQVAQPSRTERAVLRIAPGLLVEYDAPTAGGTWVWCSGGSVSRVALQAE